MSEVSVIGLDLAKHVFQVHGVDAAGRAVLCKQIRRHQVLGWYQTDANQSQFRQVRSMSGGTELPPLGESGGAGLLVDAAA